MIAIGGALGTGLFIGSGGALATSGPAGTLIAYAFVGTLVYSVMMALGEMATFIPVSGECSEGVDGQSAALTRLFIGAFTTFAARFVDPSLGFAMVRFRSMPSVARNTNPAFRDGYIGSPGRSPLH